MSIFPDHFRLGGGALRWDYTTGEVATVSQPAIDNGAVLNGAGGTARRLRPRAAGRERANCQSGRVGERTRLTFQPRFGEPLDVTLVRRTAAVVKCVGVGVDSDCCTLARKN